MRSVAASQFALATRRLCLSFSMALRTEVSSEAVSEGLRCCTLLVFRPDTPFASNHFCKSYTEAAVQPSIEDISSLLLPVLFNKMPWQHIRNWGLEPFRYPSSKDNRSSSANDMACIFLIIWMFEVIQLQRYNIKHKTQN